MSGFNTWPLQEVVQFNYTTWIARYPQFAIPAITEGVAQSLFDEATLYCDNTPTSRIPCGPRTPILNMVTAHLAQLNFGSTLQPLNPLVGRITNATEGSVTVAVDMSNQPAAAAFFQQTQYGAQAWQAMAPYRTMRYFPAQQRYLGVGGFGPRGSGRNMV